MDGAPRDDELLEAWAKGDANAGERLFERHFSAVFRFFAAKLPGEASDLTQETFLACVKNAREGARMISFKAYLFGIARNQLAMHFRARGRVASPDFSSQSIVDLAPGPSTWLSANERKTILLQAMCRLCLDHQITLELYYWDELSTEEIGAVTGVAPGTVRSRLSRAREELATIVEELSSRPAEDRSLEEELASLALAMVRGDA